MSPNSDKPARKRHRPADLPHDLSARPRIHRAAVVRLLAGGESKNGHLGTGEST